MLPEAEVFVGVPLVFWGRVPESVALCEPQAVAKNMSTSNSGDKIDFALIGSSPSSTMAGVSME
jgi:hypothetical protein